jgi:hypothetical protein
VLQYLKKEAEPASETSILLKCLEDGQSSKNEIVSVSHAATSKPCSVDLCVVVTAFVCGGNCLSYFFLSNFILKDDHKIET